MIPKSFHFLMQLILAAIIHKGCGLILPSINDESCSVRLVESIPENMTYPHSYVDNMKTFDWWRKLLLNAERSVKVTAFYWTLSGKDLNITDESTKQGEEIFALFKSLPSRGVELKIAQSGAEREISNLDEIKAAGGKVSYVDMNKIYGSGVLHNKLWIIDGRHGYIGSANMDFRSLTQVKELGLSFENCPQIMDDLDKIFEAYWLVGKMNNTIPKVWPTDLVTNYNMTNVMNININGKPANLFLTMSPPSLRPPGRTNDLDGLLNVIESAKEFVYISVMTYAPEIIMYGTNKVTTQFWPVIDDALRTAALDRQIEVRLLISHWRYTDKSQLNYLESLKSLSGIKGSKLRVRNFIVPAYTEFQKKLDHARVNHNKYMVTDNTVFIGTSNWSGDYFLTTGGTSFISYDDVNSTDTIREKAVEIFKRDWNSEYSFEL